MKAPAPLYRRARNEALRAIGSIDVDAPTPDKIEFRNEDIGFSIRLSMGNLMLQRHVTWMDIRTVRQPLIAAVVKLMLRQLAEEKHE